METLRQELKEALEKVGEIIDFLEEDGELNESDVSQCYKAIDIIEKRTKEK